MCFTCLCSEFVVFHSDKWFNMWSRWCCCWLWALSSWNNSEPAKTWILFFICRFPPPSCCLLLSELLSLIGPVENTHTIKHRPETSCKVTPPPPIQPRYVTRACHIIIRPGELKPLVRARPLWCHLPTSSIVWTLQGWDYVVGLKNKRKTLRHPPHPPGSLGTCFKWALYNDGRWFYTLGSSSVSWSGCCGHLEPVPPSRTHSFILCTTEQEGGGFGSAMQLVEMLDAPFPNTPTLIQDKSRTRLQVFILFWTSPPVTSALAVLRYLT